MIQKAGAMIPTLWVMSGGFASGKHGRPGFDIACKVAAAVSLSG
jgi:hypothetical protein